MITPSDLIAAIVVASGVCFTLGYVTARFVSAVRAQLHARRLRALLDRSTIFKFRI